VERRQCNDYNQTGIVCEQCSFYGYGMQHPNSCYRYYMVKVEHGAALPAETPSTLRAAMAGPQ
jgi:hypothetical protein